MKRPELDRLMNVHASGDTLIVTKLDQFARSVSQASDMITKLIDKGVTVNVLNIGILSNSSMSTLLRNVLLSFAQFERDMIVERTQEGKEIARQHKGYKEGRTKKYSKEKMEYAMAMLQTHSYTEVERISGISKSTLIRENRRK